MKKLVNRQIEATKETLELLIKENLRKIGHVWSVNECPMCLEFGDKNNPSGCSTKLDCPFRLLQDSRTYPCSDFARKHLSWGEHKTDISTQDIAGFLQSLLITLELMKEGK